MSVLRKHMARSSSQPTSFKLSFSLPVATGTRISANHPYSSHVLIAPAHRVEGQTRAVEHRANGSSPPKLCSNSRFIHPRLHWFPELKNYNSETPHSVQIFDGVAS